MYIEIYIYIYTGKTEHIPEAMVVQSLETLHASYLGALEATTGCYPGVTLVASGELDHPTKSISISANPCILRFP